MTEALFLLLLLCSGIILVCVFASQFSRWFGIPTLLIFMALGMLFGSDGIFKISFSSYQDAERICSVALIFIMFYGGFGTKWDVAKPAAVRAGLLSTVGVVVTAALTGGFCHFVLGFQMAESFLVGAVVSSTDAASVFSILRTQKLSLKDGTASLLELESGSNDPMSYMLTMAGLTLLGQGEVGGLGVMFFAQMACGIGIGVASALVSVWLLRRIPILQEGLDAIFIVAMVLLAYALPSLIGGNGYLSVYLMGIILGNSRIDRKKTLVHFFDGITGLAQIVIFFLLGLLSFPHRLPQVAGMAVSITLFLSLAARPAAVFLILLPFRVSIRQCLLVSWAGLRGAASIVFSIMVMASGVALPYDLFHIVFCIALFSVALQGTLLPRVARKLDMVDEKADVSRTFTDYQEEAALTLMRLSVPGGHNWENKRISEIHLPTGSLALMIKRGEETIVPKGNTKILKGDTLILSVPAYQPQENEKLEEIRITKKHSWCGQAIEELKLPEHVLIALIQRGEENIIPRGKTRIEENDTVVLYR
ncbi:MAG: potassium/proton antiporter [Candidatus Limivivens sp.]|nr:potassium/proton antiporter [Candidatus Limivivens sp.]